MTLQLAPNNAINLEGYEIRDTPSEYSITDLRMAKIATEAFMEECKKQKPLYTQINGDHYKKYPIQPYEYCHKNGLGYLESNVIKYVTRYKDKGGLEDLRKAIHTLEVLIELEYMGDKWN